MPRANEIWVFFGLVASGKSTVAEAWAKRCGAFYYNSDLIRKELAGIPPTQSCRNEADQGIYSKEFTRKTYDEMLSRAEKQLVRGGSVVLDASYQAKEERDRVRLIAQRLDRRVIFIRCHCSEEEVKRRLDLRSEDPGACSDGRWEIYLLQKERYAEPTDLPAEILIDLDTENDLETLLSQIGKISGEEQNV